MSKKPVPEICHCTHKRTVSGNRCGACGGRVGPTHPPPSSLGDKDYDTPCEVCGEKPTLHPTGLCGPCCTGESDTLGGNW